MTGKKLPRDIILRVNRFYDVAWTMQRGDDFNVLLDHLPKDICSRVKKEIFDYKTVEEIVKRSTDFHSVPKQLVHSIIASLRLEVTSLYIIHACTTLLLHYN